MLKFKSLIGQACVARNNKAIEIKFPVITIKIPAIDASKAYHTMQLNKVAASYLGVKESERIAFMQDESGKIFIADKRAIELIGDIEDNHPIVSKSLTFNFKKLADKLLEYLKSNGITIENKEEEYNFPIVLKYFVDATIDFKCLIVDIESMESILQKLKNGEIEEDYFTYKEPVIDTQLEIKF